MWWVLNETDFRIFDGKVRLSIEHSPAKIRRPLLRVHVGKTTCQQTENENDCNESHDA